MADYICSSSHFVASLQSDSYICIYHKSYIYIIKLCVHGVKTYDIKGKEALTGDWKELNKETHYVMYVYKTTLRFTSAHKYKLTKSLTFIWVLTFI